MKCAREGCCIEVPLKPIRGGLPRLFCSNRCRNIVKCCRYRQSDKYRVAHTRYFRSDRGKAAQNRYLQSDKGKTIRNRYCQTDRWLEVHSRSQIKYLQTDKGHAWIERHKNTWQGKKAYLIFIEERPCAVCGETDKSLLRCDHILARALGGTDDWVNLQVLCCKHHREKTIEDMKKIRNKRVGSVGLLSV